MLSWKRKNDHAVRGTRIKSWTRCMKQIFRFEDRRISVLHFFACPLFLAHFLHCFLWFCNFGVARSWNPFPCDLRGPESTLCLMQASLNLRFDGFTQIWKKDSTNRRFTTFPFVESSSIDVFVCWEVLMVPPFAMLYTMMFEVPPHIASLFGNHTWCKSV